ncbi:MAG: Tol-Pal system beta propeller repeat protein TolB [Holosporaceae bacterium]|jgi:TolB protein|nr:Tol-Pal system beta propeller repeat protein TolB [Holosporaceae bacterium]
MVLALAVVTLRLDARVVIDINKGVMKPVYIAVDVFDPFSRLKDMFLDVLRNDLETTFLFKTIPQNAFMQRLGGMEDKPNFPLWKNINAQYLASVEITPSAGMINISLALYDVLSEKAVEMLSLSANASNWRKMAHLVANRIYERVTGERGYFDTQILYVSVQNGANTAKVHRLAIMDQDGFNHKFLTSGANMVLTPRLSPNGNECSFFAYREKVVNGRRIPISASVYRLDLQNPSSPELISNFNGMSYAPRYSPDGRLLIFSLSDRGSSSIYTINIKTKELNRLTRGRCIDTSPCYSPDGKYIVFNSDRGGSQQLYIMDSDGSNVRRLSFSKGRYATPVWSPRGDWIAFSKFGKGMFCIGIIRPDGSCERMLASGYLTEGPSWSPNGRVLLFSHQDHAHKERIYSVDITGYNKREIATPTNAVDPDWSKNNILLPGISPKVSRGKASANVTKAQRDNETFVE